MIFTINLMIFTQKNIVLYNWENLNGLVYIF